MSNTKRYIIHQDYPCPSCDGTRNIYRTMIFDVNDEPQTVSTDFECMDCDQTYKIVREGAELFLIRSKTMGN